MSSLMDYLNKGSQIFLSSWSTRLKPKKYSGTADQICHNIVKDCWNGHYFQVSTRNFPEFWTRDFGWCAQSLIKLGYEKEVHQTLRYALNRFQKYKKITTTINSKGNPFDFPTMAVDSLPWLIHSIKISSFPYLLFKSFLNQQIQLFFETVVNNHTGLVKPENHFSSIKDFSIRKSSCYDNTMVALLAKDLKSMKLLNPFTNFDYSELLKRHFWNGKYFYDDLSKQDYVAGDANLFPFILGLIKDKEMMESSIKTIQENQLDSPFPLKYTTTRNKVRFILEEKLAMRNYESNSIWTHMGLLFIKFVKQIDPEKSKEYQQVYQEMIEKQRGFLEVLTPKGKPFKTWFYHSDRGMLWACNYLTL